MLPDRVVAVPLAASAMFRPRRGSSSCRAAKPYFLFVGTLEPRKNVARLIEAWREVRKTHDVDLVLAGRARAGFPAPATRAGSARLWALCPKPICLALYSGALACVYPSLYEGFGLPVLEAMQCGAVVVTSRDPAIMEVSGGEAAIHAPRAPRRRDRYAALAAGSGRGRLARRRTSPTARTRRRARRASSPGSAPPAAPGRSMKPPEASFMRARALFLSPEPPRGWFRRRRAAIGIAARISATDVFAWMLSISP